MQNGVIGAKPIANSLSSHLSTDAVAQHTKLYKNEDIPLTISASLMRTRAKTLGNAHEPIDRYDSNESNDDDCSGDGGNGDGDDGDYTYNSPYSNPTIIHYSTMSSNARDYFRKTAGHLHRSVNNNNSTIASTNCYRWHNQSDEVVLHSLRNNSMTMAATTKAKSKANALAVHSNHRTYNNPGRRESKHHQHNHHQQQQKKLNQINNNCIVTNKKQSTMVQNTHNNHNSIDQNNGNQYPPRLYH